MRRSWLFAVGLALGASALASACGNESAVIGDGDAGSSDTGAPLDDAGAPLDDGGEEITDGGSNIDPDGGPADAGLPDGGACNAVINDAPAVVSTCISVLPAFTGGALVAGKYWLTGVAALGSPAFCKSSFVPTGIKETVEMTLSGATATMNVAFEVGGFPTYHRTSTLTPGANDSSPAAGEATCPPGGAGPVRYTSRVNSNGKQIVLALLPYGKGAAIYRFEKQ